MNALIFAAGLGTRLKPLTDTMPKALVRVAGEPLLQRTIDTLYRAGATEIVVNVHHFADQVKRYVAERTFPVPVRISDESEALLDTGGGLRQAVPLFSEPTQPVLIHNVDILSNAPLAEIYAQHRPGDAATLLVSPRNTQRYLLFNDEGLLCGWTNLASGALRLANPSIDVSQLRRYAFSGIHVFSPTLLPEMEAFPEKFPIMDFYLQMCAKHRIRARLMTNLRFLDVGKQDSLVAAEDFVRNTQTGFAEKRTHLACGR